MNSHSASPKRARLVPRKTARQQRSAMTVASILEAAARILERQGLAAFTTNAVAAKAGVSIGSLYQYFPGKDALMAALIEADARNFHAALSLAACDEGKQLEADVTRLVAVAVAHQTARPALARIFDFEERRLALGGESAAQQQAIGALVVRILARHRERLGDLDPAEAAGDLAAIARGLIDEAGARGAADAAALNRRVLRAVLGYLLGPARTLRAARRRAGTAA